MPAVPAEAGSWPLLRRLIVRHVRPYIGRLLLAAGCMGVVALMTAANAWLLQPAIDDVFIAGDSKMLLLVPAAVLAVAVLKGFGSYAQNVIMNGVGQRIIAETQVSMYAHLIRADLAFLQTIHTGKLLSSFLYDANLLRDAVSRAITGIAKDALSLLALATVMVIQDWKLALVSLTVLPFAGLFVRRLGKRTRTASTRTQEETGKLGAHLAETLEGARIVKAYGREATETARARDQVEARLRQILKVIRARSAAVPATEALGGVAIAIAILYGGWQAQSGTLTLGAFTAFLAALLMAYQPVKSLASLHTALQEGLAAAQRIFAVLDQPISIRDRPGASALRVAAGEIRFDAVAFRYADGVPALNGVDLTIPGGATVALVGRSGAGKSTLLNLVPRFHDPSEGTVGIDGQDLCQVGLASLRQAIALVSQDTVLFDDSVFANIAYGRPGADRAAVEAAARAAAAHDFIAALPQGYDTEIGEKGVRLSGGQRQRVAIARAILRDAPILLLDEATSSLDTESETQVQRALARLMRGRTTLVIAHRLSTVRAADLICVLDQGRIVEQGTHGELQARGGPYARLLLNQLADDAPAAAHRASA